MNLAFPALVIVVLALPGILARYAYRKAFHRESRLGPISQETAYGLGLAVLLHLAWASGTALLLLLTDIRIDVRAVLILAGAPTILETDPVSSVAGYPYLVGAYFLTLYAFSYAGGHYIKKLVRSMGWHRRWAVFRSDNEWDRRLLGDDWLDPDDIDAVYVAVIVEQGGQSYLYRGLVDDWTLTREGELDTVVLAAAHRRALSVHGDESAAAPGYFTGPNYERDPRYYNIRGHVFVIRYEEAKTLNIEYIFLENIADEEDEPVEELGSRPMDAEG